MDAPARVNPIHLSCLGLALTGLLGCGPEFEPRQGRFTLESCESEVDLASGRLHWQFLPEPVLERGPQGAWDSVDALNPSVVRRDGTFFNFYSGFDGRRWRTGLATSPDGLVWDKHPAPVLAPDPQSWEGAYIAANGSALDVERSFLYWFQAGPRGSARIGLAWSRDGTSWEKHGSPVLEAGPAGSWDEAAVADPYVIRCRRWFYLFYLGQNRGGLQRLGVARSRDGFYWQKSHTNPILDTGPPASFDEFGLGEPAVLVGKTGFQMLYTGRDAGERRRLGWAVSSDGVNWKKMSSPIIQGEREWNSRVVCDATFWSSEERLWMWFGGGDEASPDENLNGRIGAATAMMNAPGLR